MRAPRWVVNAAAAALVASSCRPCLGDDRDPGLRAVREAVSVVGTPDPRRDPDRLVDPPAPIPDADDTIASIIAMHDAIEAWIAWGSRAGAATVVHGIAGPDTSASVEHAARHILTGCARAMEATDRIIARMDAADGHDDDSVLSRVVIARRITIPLRAARAALWAGAARDAADPGSIRILRHAAELAGAVDPSRPGTALERAALLAQIALAADQPAATAGALAEADRAVRELGAETPMGTRIELGLVRARLAPATGTARRSDAILDALATDATDGDRRDFGTVALSAFVRGRIVLDAAIEDRSSAVRARAAFDAAAAVAAIIDDDSTTEPSRAVRRSIAMEALRGIGERMAPGDRWPALVVGATADRAIGQPNTDAQTVIAWLDDWLAAPISAQDPHADEVRLQLARFLAAIGNPADAARAAALASGFADRNPTDDRAGAMVALACASGVDARRGSQMDHARLVEILRAADTASFEVPGRDRWRIVLMHALGEGVATSDDAALARLVLAQLEIARRIRSAAESLEAAALMADAARWMIRSDRMDAEPSGESDPILVAAVVAAHAEAVGAARDATLTRAEIAMATGAFRDAEALARTLDPTASDPGVRDVVVRAAALRGEMDEARGVLTAMASDSAQDAANAAEWIGRAAWSWIGPFADALPESVPEDARPSAMAAALIVASEFQPGRPEASRRAGIAASLAGMHADALRVLTPIHAADIADTEVGLALADAMRGAGDDAGAFAILRKIAADAEKARRYDRACFRSWLRMTQILDTMNADGSRTEAIAREVFRLTRSPGLASHPDLAAGFRVLADRYPARVE